MIPRAPSPLFLALAVALNAACGAQRPTSQVSALVQRSYTTSAARTARDAVASPFADDAGQSDDRAAIGCEEDADCTVLDASRVCGVRDFKPVLVSEYQALSRLNRRVTTPDGGACDAPQPNRREKVALCERNRCTLYDEAVALRWVASLAPQLDDLIAADDDDIAKAPWFQDGGHVVLYVRSDWLDELNDGTPRERHRPVACTAVEFVAHDHALHADVDDAGRPPPKYGCRRRVTLAGHATVTAGVCEYPHGRIGVVHDDEWEPQCLGGGRVLSSFDERGLVYDGMLVTRVTPACAWETVDLPGCEPSSCRTCRIVLERRGEDHCGSGTSMLGTGHIAESHTRAPNPVCGACLPDEHEALLPRMAHILAGRAYVLGGDSEGLRLFRRKEDCEASLR